MITLAPPTSVDLPKLLFAPQAKVEKALGPGHRPKRVPAFFFFPKGFYEIRINSLGPDMSDLAFSFDRLNAWPVALLTLGVNSAGVTVKSVPPAPSAVQLKRNQLVLEGVKGLALSPKSHKPWHITYEEDAVVNNARAESLRSKIQASTGEARLALIRSCYDWRSKIEFDCR